MVRRITVLKNPAKCEQKKQLSIIKDERTKEAINSEQTQTL